MRSLVDGAAVGSAQLGGFGDEVVDGQVNGVAVGQAQRGDALGQVLGFGCAEAVATDAPQRLCHDVGVCESGTSVGDGGEHLDGETLHVDCRIFDTVRH